MGNDTITESFNDAHGYAVFTGGPDRVCTGLQLHYETDKPLLISGVNEKTRMVDILDKCGYLKKKDDTDDITLDYDAKDTSDNAESLQPWINENNLSSVSIITNDFHVKRTWVEAKCHVDSDIDLDIISLETNEPNSWRKSLRSIAENTKAGAKAAICALH